MAMFWCGNCDNLKDSDDGCIEDPTNPTGLWCVDCENESQCSWCGEFLHPDVAINDMHPHCRKEARDEKRAEQMKDNRLTGDV